MINESINLKDIKEYKNNVKLYPKEQIQHIKNSIKEFGYADDIAIDENDTIIYGHGRFKALKELQKENWDLKDGNGNDLDYNAIPVKRLINYTDEQKRAYILAHNQTTLSSGFDMDIVNTELGDILDINMSDFGFEKIEEKIQEDEKEKSEIEFSEVLGEEHNYIVLYFDNDIDWLQAESLFDIKPVKCGSTRKDKKISENMQRVGIGRVLNGAEAINKLLESKI